MTSEGTMVTHYCLLASRLVTDSTEELFVRTKHNMRIFGVIPFIKVQNDI